MKKSELTKRIGQRILSEANDLKRASTVSKASSRVYSRLNRDGVATEYFLKNSEVQHQEMQLYQN